MTCRPPVSVELPCESCGDTREVYTDNGWGTCPDCRPPVSGEPSTCDRCLHSIDHHREAGHDGRCSVYGCDCRRTQWFLAKQTMPQVDWSKSFFRVVDGRIVESFDDSEVLVEETPEGLRYIIEANHV